MKTRIFRRLRDFARDNEGSISVEFVMVMPILFWSFMAIYVYFDGYRQSTIQLKAAYTVSDLLSRETESVTDTYIDSMHDLLQILTRADSSTDLRVSVVRWDEGDSRYYIDWSESRNYGDPHDNTSIRNLDDYLPVMPDNERVILVETRNVYEPDFDIGMTDKDLENFVFTRPRFAPQLVFSDG
ncbi:MAG: TadE/TadG family type IV pilus assembly protein [Paracoccaceae bacterium]